MLVCKQTNFFLFCSSFDSSSFFRCPIFKRRSYFKHARGDDSWNIKHSHSNDPPFRFGTHGNVRFAGTDVRSNVLQTVVLSREITAGIYDVCQVLFTPHPPPSHPSLTLAFETDYGRGRREQDVLQGWLFEVLPGV